MSTESQPVDTNKIIEEIKKNYKDKDYQKTIELCQYLHDIKKNNEIELGEEQWFNVLFHLGTPLGFFGLEYKKLLRKIIYKCLT